MPAKESAHPPGQTATEGMPGGRTSNAALGRRPAQRVGPPGRPGRSGPAQRSNNGRIKGLRPAASNRYRTFSILPGPTAPPSGTEAGDKRFESRSGPVRHAVVPRLAGNPIGHRPDKPRIHPSKQLHGACQLTSRHPSTARHDHGGVNHLSHHHRVAHRKHRR